MNLKKSIFIFVITLTLISVFNINFELLGDKFWTLLIFASLAILILCAKKILTDTSFENRYFKVLFFLFIFYQAIVIFRGINFDYKEFKELILIDFLFWNYVIPLFVFYDKKLNSFFYLLQIIFYVAVCFLFTAIAKPSLIQNRISAESFIIPFAFGCGFILLNARYLSRKKSMIAFIALALGLLSFTYLARRNGILSFGSLIIFGLFVNMKTLSFLNFFKLIPIFLLIIITMLVGFDYLPSALTSRLSERATEDTRSDVFDNFFKGMDDDMVFGKGMNGKYYSPMGGGIEDEGIEFATVEYRNVIENGYLQLILNGGIVYLIIFLLITLPAIILGFFKSKNHFVKSCSIIIFLWLIDMFAFGLPRLTLEYILVWISIGVCYKTSLREKTNDEIYFAFNNPELL